MNNTEKKLVIGLEIGTTKILVAIGEISIESSINVIGIGTHLTYGIEEWQINDLKILTKCIKNAIKDAEKMANCKIEKLYLAFSNPSINCQNEIGISPIFSEEVTIEDIKNVVNTAKSINIKNDYQILHVIPQEYSIDGQLGIKNPIGLFGKRIQANVHIITCQKKIEKNIKKAVQNCGIRVKKVIFSGLATSEAILTEEEKNSGVCMIDMGGGKIDIVIYISGNLQYTGVIPYAGNTITKDIAYAFSLSYKDAELIKLNYSQSILQDSLTNKKFDIVNKKNEYITTLSNEDLISVIEPRYLELLQLVNNIIKKVTKKLKKKGKNYKINSGIIFTGGASNLPKLKKYAKKIFQRNIIIKKPQNVENLSIDLNKSEYTTVIGLLNYVKEEKKNIIQEKKKKIGIFKNFLIKINSWFKKK